MSAFQNFKNDLLKKGLEYFGLYYGTYAGIVMSNDDPEKRGRLQIMCPEVWGNDKAIEKWVSPRSIFAGKKIGFHAMPEEKDNIWITFRNGNVDFPLWEYGWWTKDNAIEKAEKGVYVFATPKGHLWLVDENKETIYFSFKDGQAIEITKDTINLGTVGGSNEPAVLGDKNEAVIKKLADGVNDIISAIQNATVVPQDGGASFKAALIASLTSTVVSMTEVKNTDAAQTKSNVVKLD